MYLKNKISYLNFLNIIYIFHIIKPQQYKLYIHDQKTIIQILYT